MRETFFSNMDLLSTITWYICIDAKHKIWGVFITYSWPITVKQLLILNFILKQKHRYEFSTCKLPKHYFQWNQLYLKIIKVWAVKIEVNTETLIMKLAVVSSFKCKIIAMSNHKNVIRTVPVYPQSVTYSSVNEG